MNPAADSPVPRIRFLPTEFADANAAEPDVVRLAVILKADVAFQRSIFHGALVELRINDLFAVEFHLQMAANAREYHAIPFVRRP